MYIGCDFSTRNPSHIVAQPTAGWLYMMGRGSPLGVGGSAIFINCSVGDFQNKEFCEVEASAVQNFTFFNGCSFEWHVNHAWNMVYFPYADIRRMRNANVPVEFPGTRILCNINRGRISFNGLFAADIPVDSPVGGQWEIGDTINSPTPEVGGAYGWTCVSAGTPGTWRQFGEISQVPLTLTANGTVGANYQHVINNKSGSALTVTMPAAASYPGKGITITNNQAQAVNSASSNVVPITGGAAGTAILGATSGAWATLVSNGTNWVITRS